MKNNRKKDPSNWLLNKVFSALLSDRIRFAWVGTRSQEKKMINIFIVLRLGTIIGFAFVFNPFRFCLLHTVTPKCVIDNKSIHPKTHFFGFFSFAGFRLNYLLRAASVRGHLMAARNLFASHPCWSDILLSAASPRTTIVCTFCSVKTRCAHLVARCRFH